MLHRSTKIRLAYRAVTALTNMNDALLLGCFAAATGWGYNNKAMAENAAFDSAASVGFYALPVLHALQSFLEVLNTNRSREMQTCVGGMAAVTCNEAPDSGANIFRHVLNAVSTSLFFAATVVVGANQPSKILSLDLDTQNKALACMVLGYFLLVLKNLIYTFATIFPREACCDGAEGKAGCLEITSRVTLMSAHLIVFPVLLAVLGDGQAGLENQTYTPYRKKTTTKHPTTSALRTTMAAINTTVEQLTTQPKITTMAEPTTLAHSNWTTANFTTAAAITVPKVDSATPNTAMAAFCAFSSFGYLSASIFFLCAALLTRGYEPKALRAANRGVLALKNLNEAIFWGYLTAATGWGYHNEALTENTPLDNAASVSFYALPILSTLQAVMERAHTNRSRRILSGSSCRLCLDTPTSIVNLFRDLFNGIASTLFIASAAIVGSNQPSKILSLDIGTQTAALACMLAAYGLLSAKNIFNVLTATFPRNDICSPRNSCSPESHAWIYKATAHSVLIITTLISMLTLSAVLEGHEAGLESQTEGQIHPYTTTQKPTTTALYTTMAAINTTMEQLTTQPEITTVIVPTTVAEITTQATRNWTTQNVTTPSLFATTTTPSLAPNRIMSAFCIVAAIGYMSASLLSLAAVFLTRNYRNNPEAAPINSLTTPLLDSNRSRRNSSVSVAMTVMSTGSKDYDPELREFVMNSRLEGIKPKQLEGIALTDEEETELDQLGCTLSLELPKKPVRIVGESGIYDMRVLKEWINEKKSVWPRGMFESPATRVMHPRKNIKPVPENLAQQRDFIKRVKARVSGGVAGISANP